MKCAEHFRRAKSGVLGYYPVRPHWGPEWGENWDWCDSMPAPELAEPTSLVRNMGYLIRPLRGHLPLKGKAGGCHFKAFPFRGRWLAEGQTDEAGGPVWDRPLQKRTSSIIFAVGAGVLTRPLWRWAPFVGCGLPDAPFHLHAKRRRGGPRGRPCRILNQVSLPFVGAAISRPSLPPRRKAKR